jgi:MYXO-CTERM domain-containing protein
MSAAWRHKESDMSSHVLRITAVALALLATTPVLAQEATDDTATPAATTTAGDDDFDWGWIGLLGLLGLAGLAGRRRDTTTYTGTTPR